MIDVRKLRMLVELERLGTITAVARELHLTAPGVSMQLSALERELGIALTERRGRNVALTPAGRMLARHGERVADQLTLAEFELTALREGAVGTYRIASFPSFARTIVAPVWGALHADSNDGLVLRLVQLEPQDSIPALSAGEVDLAIIHAYSNFPRELRPGIVSTPLIVEDVWLATRDDAEPGSPVAHLDRYADADWVVPQSRLSCYEMIQRACGLAGFAPRIVAEGSDFSMLLALVAAGVGVALVPRLTVAAAPDGVLLRPLATPVTRHSAIAVRSTMDADPGIVHLRALLVAAAETAIRQPTHAGE